MSNNVPKHFKNGCSNNVLENLSDLKRFKKVFNFSLLSRGKRNNYFWEKFTTAKKLNAKQIPAPQAIKE